MAPPVFAVADGMGDHAAGEVASEIAIKRFVENAPDTADGDALARAVVEANRGLFAPRSTGAANKGMGTTMTAAVVDGVRLVVAQVGDSRAYLLHRGNFSASRATIRSWPTWLKRAKSPEEQARVHPPAQRHHPSAWQRSANPSRYLRDDARRRRQAAFCVRTAFRR